VPKTEKNGRTHTSIITVAVLKIPEDHELKIKDSDIEYRFIRASSKGGQHANKTESGVVVKHLTSGIEAKSTSDRSQHINKQLAVDALKSKLFEKEQIQKQSGINNNRSDQIGTGHRSDKIRTIRYIDGIVKCEVTGQTKSLNSYLKGDITF
jgi:peptide chain release factor 1